MPKWLLPLLIAAGAALGLWLLLDRRGGGLSFRSPFAPPPDPNAAAARALCTGGTVYAMGPSGVMMDPLCAQLAPAVAPLVGGAVGLGVAAFDAGADVIEAGGRAASGAVMLPVEMTRDVYGGGKEVVGDLYDGGKEVVGDIYGAAKDIVTAPVSGLKAIGSWLGF